MIIRLMEEADLQQAAKVHQQAFVRQQRSYEWIKCNFNAAPRFLSFVAELNDEVVGYIVWGQKSGFRPEVILELEQLAVLPSHHNQGIATQLITLSLPQVKKLLAEQGSKLKHIMVNTRADNYAQQIYQKLLGAEVEMTIKSLYSADEVFMIARNVCPD